ncbi:hypothetical protein ACQZV8_10020 [Magnetococcales bacterium HHB-1]
MKLFFAFMGWSLIALALSAMIWELFRWYQRKQLHQRMKEQQLATIREKIVKQKKLLIN